MHILKNVCYITTSFSAIHFFYDSVIVSQEHLKQSTVKETVFISQYFLQPSIILNGLRLIREKVVEYVYLRKTIEVLLF